MWLTKTKTKTKQRTNTAIPLVEPTANVPPSDIKSTDVRGDSAIITLTDLWRNSKKNEWQWKQTLSSFSGVMK